MPLYNPDTNYVDLTTDQTVGGIKTFSQNLKTNAQVIADAVNGSIELGNKLSANTPYIDFNSSGFNNDFDARLISQGGANGPGQSYLFAQCKQFIATQGVSVGAINQSAGSLGVLEARAGGSGAGAGAAMISFHRPGSFACYLGLDTDNRLKVGGWSMGAVAYQIWHEGNLSPVDLGSAQNITGVKTFNDQINLNTTGNAGAKAKITTSYFLDGEGTAYHQVNLNLSDSISSVAAVRRAVLNIGSNSTFMFGDLGQIFVYGSAPGLYIADNKVLGSRITGWGVPTGVSSRAAFATTTVTLATLASVVKALIEDLKTHGLIG